jgi:4-hydroxy-tetrahydrodipicolinate reductase
VNIMFAVNEFLAKIMNSFPQYDVKMTETHHTQKLDCPKRYSNFSLADQIIKNLAAEKDMES